MGGEGRGGRAKRAAAGERECWGLVARADRRCRVRTVQERKRCTSTDGAEQRCMDGGCSAGGVLRRCSVSGYSSVSCHGDTVRVVAGLAAATAGDFNRRSLSSYQKRGGLGVNRGVFLGCRHGATVSSRGKQRRRRSNTGFLFLTLAVPAPAKTSRGVSWSPVARGRWPSSAVEGAACVKRARCRAVVGAWVGCSLAW
jgi:hypothetical protein